MKKIILSVILVLASCSLFAQTQVTEARPDSPSVSNCFPFGNSVSWTPYAGFIYKNISSFQLNPGDKIKFDLGRTNETALRRDIYFARTTSNGGTTSMQWVKVASNSQTPANPYGDNTIGNYELTYTAESAFNFPGGGFMIAIGNPVGNDTDCDQVLVSTSNVDSSGKFVGRFFRQSLSNNYNYGVQNTSSIGGFRIESVNQDDTPPVVRVRDAEVSLNASGQASITPPDINNGTTDNSGGNISYELNQSGFDCDDLIGGSLNFDGADDNVRLSTPINIGQGNSTVEAWVKVPEIGHGGLSANERVGIILGNYSSPNNINYEIHARGQVRFYWNNGQVNILGTKDLRDGKWHHLAFVRIASQNRFIGYIDGIEEFNVVKASSQVSFSSTHRIGGDNRSNPPNFHGNIDELRIWNYARSQSQIASEMLDALKGSESGLLNYWNFEESAGSSLTDLAGGNTGTFNLMDPANDWDYGAPNNTLIPVRLTATDASNNSAAATAWVRVKDDLAPVITPQQITVELDAQGSATISEADVQSMISDNCQITCIELSRIAFDCSSLGANTITLTAMDNSFNASTEQISVVVVDNTQPVITGKPIEVTLTASGTVSITPQEVLQAGFDNCGTIDYTLSQQTFGGTDAANSPLTIQLTGTDLSNNATTVDVEVTVIDPVPTVTTQNITVALDSNGEVTITPQQIDDGSASVVGLSGLSLDITSFNCSDIGVNEVVLTATSTLGSLASETATVTVVDDTLPTVLTQNINADLSNGAVSITPSMIDAGSYDNCEIQSITLDRSFFSCSDLGIQTVTLTVTDVNDNTASATATVTVRDVTPPTVLTKNRVYGLDDNGQRTITARDIDNFSYDECGDPVTISIDKTSFDCSSLGDNIVTLTVTDASGNVNTGTAIVTIQDAAEPEVIVRDYLLVELDASGNASITPADLDLGSRDNCGLDRLEISQSAFTCADVGTLVVTTRAYDVNGNMDVNRGQTLVEVRDVTQPDLFVQDLTVQLDENGIARITAEQMDNGSTDTCGIASLSVSKDTFDCSNVGPNTVTLTVTDINGNFATQTATVTVVDDTLPTVLTQNINADLSNGAVSITPSMIDAGSYDNCEIQSITLDRSFFSCSDLGAQTVTLTVTDVNGNTASATATVTVRDVTPPTVLTKNRVYGLDDNGQRTITARDIDNFSYDECGDPVTISIDKTSFDCSSLGDNIVILTVTDASGNVNTRTAIVTIQDAAEPEVIVRDYLLVELDASGNASITPADLDLGSRDNCGLDRLEISQSAFTCADVGTLVVTTRAYDVNGNMDVNRGQTLVEVRDVTQPDVFVQDLTVQLDENGIARITAEQMDNGSTDTCGIASLSVSKDTFDCSNVGPNTVTLTVTDINGNYATQTATVTVVDDTLPTVLTQNINADLSNGAVSITPSMIDAGSYDNCEIQSITLDRSFFSCSDLGIQTVTLTVTDVNGNTASATATVTVRDVTPPTVLTKNRVYGLDDNGQRTITARDIDNFSYDECGDPVTISIDKTSFDCSSLGDNIVTLTVTDASGNVNTGTAIVTIQDAAEPEVIVRDYLLVELDASGNASITPADLDLGSRDNCGLDRLEISQSAFTCADVGTLVVTTRAYDVNGNMDVNRGQTLVEVRDVTQPDVFVQDLTVQLDENGIARITAEQMDNGSTDTCGIASLSVSKDTFDCSNVGPNTVTLTVTDINGNFATQTATVTVTDVTPAQVLTKDITIDLDTDGSAIITTEMIDNGSYDACGIASYALDTTTFDCDDAGANTVTLTVTDVNGNVSSNTAIVTLVDLIYPTAIAQDIEVFLDENGEASIGPASVDNGSYDNCSFTLSLDNATFNCANVGTNTVVLTATDASGNSSTAKATVTVTDIVLPTVVPRNIEAFLDENGSTSIIVSNVDGGTFDNCGLSTITIDVSSFDCEDLGDNEVTLTATDVNGNVNTGVAVVTVIDNIAPTVGVKEIIVSLDENGFASITPEEVLLFSEDDVVRDTECALSSSTDKYVMKVKGEYYKKGHSNNKGRGHGKGKGKGHDRDNDDRDGYDQYEFSGGNLLRRLDGTLLLTGVLTDNDKSSDGYELSIELAGNYDYNTWRSTKGKVKEVYRSDYHLDWRFYTIRSGSLTGTGDNAGETYPITAYSNEEGFQLGSGANGDNLNEGLRGKFKTELGKGELRLDISDCELLPVPEGTVYTSDNCSITAFSLDQDTFTCNDLAQTVVNLTATDQSGNQTTVPVSVTVLDQIAPVAEAVDYIEVSLEADGTITVDASLLDAGSTDNTDCDLTFTLSESFFDCDDIGRGSTFYIYGEEDTHKHKKGRGHYSHKGKGYGHKKTKLKGHKVTLTVTDAAGNSDQVETYIVVRDDLAPVIAEGPVTVVVYNEKQKWGRKTYTKRYSEYVKESDIAPLVADNCEVNKIRFDRRKYDVADAGINHLQVWAEDKSGNVSEGTVLVDVIDISSYGRYVEVCYKGQTKRVKKDKVQDWLRKGATLGACSTDIMMTINGENNFDNAIDREVTNEPLISLGAFPNPTRGETTIRFSSDVAGPASLVMMTSGGVHINTLYEGDMEANQHIEVKYDAGDLPNGVYLLRLVTAGQVRNIKLMIKQ